jgi:enoyl-CoA hydratase/carnithine racemase
VVCATCLTLSPRRGSAGADLLANALGVGGTKWDSTRIHNQERFSRVVSKIARMPQMVIAAVHGAVSGGGFALALAADMRVAAESAKMNAAFVQIGLSGAEMGSSYHLPRLCGLGNAMEILATGDAVDAASALRLGIVNKVVPDAELRAASVELARRCLRASWLGLRQTKQQLRGASDGVSLEHAIHNEDLGQVLCLNDKETQAYTAAKVARFLPSKDANAKQAKL